MSVTKPARALVRRALEKTVFQEYRERVERFNWNARLVKTISASAEAPVFDSRDALYRHVNEAHLRKGQTPIDYLEFGVFRGDSLRKWSKLNGCPESRFFGFDSFEGLPEDWIEGWPKGTFDTGGNAPQTDDKRVQFVKGWFQDSLPGFLASFQPHNPIVVHSDSDLYSSTLYCFTKIDSLLPPGTVVVFDDFYDPIHEYRAVIDYCSAYRRSFKIVAATTNFHQVAAILS